MIVNLSENTMTNFLSEPLSLYAFLIGLLVLIRKENFSFITKFGLGLLLAILCLSIDYLIGRIGLISVALYFGIFILIILINSIFSSFFSKPHKSVFVFVVYVITTFLSLIPVTTRDYYQGNTRVEVKLGQFKLQELLFKTSKDLPDVDPHDWDVEKRVENLSSGGHGYNLILNNPDLISRHLYTLTNQAKWLRIFDNNFYINNLVYLPKNSTNQSSSELGISYDYIAPKMSLTKKVFDLIVNSFLMKPLQEQYSVQDSSQN